MTDGQVRQLQDLSKCYGLPHGMADWVCHELLGATVGAKMDKWDKTWLRRLTYLYRNQIAAIRKNQS